VRSHSAPISQALVTCAARSDGQRLLIGNGEAVSFERHYLAGMIGEHAQALETEIDEDLGADAAFMLEEPLPGGILIELAASVVEHARHFA
jgi:hypothetical protein